MTQCATCRATYASALADGTRYFHACPSLSEAEVIAATGLNVDRTKWTVADAATFAAASRVRPNARNENVPAPAVLAATIAAANLPHDVDYQKKVNALLETALVSAGAGTTIVADVQAQQAQLS